MAILLISIIIPVYNAEKYIKDCVDSILSQTFNDWELILVNDGSKDSSGRICDEFSLQDQRIRTFHNINTGAAAARIFGTSKANGEYLCFVDADDFLPKDALEGLYHSVYGNDIIVGGYCRIYDEQNKDFCRLTSGHFSNDEYLLMLLSGNWKLYGPVAKLFKKTLFDNVMPKIPREICVGEDLLMNVFFASYAKNVVFLSNIVYNYNQILTSATHTFSYTFEYMKMYMKVLDKILETGNVKKRESLLSHYKLSMMYNVMLDDVNDDINYHSPEVEDLCKLQIHLNFKEYLIVLMIRFFIVRILYRKCMNSYRSGNYLFRCLANIFLK